MDAQVAAARIGTERMVELVGRYGTETFDLACEALMGHAERLMRQAIAKLPDGVYRAETAIDGLSGRGSGAVAVEATGCCAPPRSTLYGDPIPH
jgi:N-methylhydantoinase B/oxoprolinase/acetone carboxylase alpha subunit